MRKLILAAALLSATATSGASAAISRSIPASGPMRSTPCTAF